MGMLHIGSNWVNEVEICYQTEWLEMIYVCWCKAVKCQEEQKVSTAHMRMQRWMSGY